MSWELDLFIYVLEIDILIQGNYMKILLNKMISDTHHGTTHLMWACLNDNIFTWFGASCNPLLSELISMI